MKISIKFLLFIAILVLAAFWLLNAANDARQRDAERAADARAAAARLNEAKRRAEIQLEEINNFSSIHP